jgi:hypothetical protein
VWWGLELIKALHDSPDLKGIALHTLQDEIIATLLLHDMVKNGKGLNAQGYPLEEGVTGTHGTELANKIAPFFPNNFPHRIISGIAGHMGIWTTDFGDKPNNIKDSTERAFANLIHLADYCASRKVDEIYSKLENENDATKNTTNTTKEVVTKSPICPGVRKTESRQTDSETGSQ